MNGKSLLAQPKAFLGKLNTKIKETTGETKKKSGAVALFKEEEARRREERRVQNANKTEEELRLDEEVYTELRRNQNLSSVLNNPMPENSSNVFGLIYDAGQGAMQNIQQQTQQVSLPSISYSDFTHYINRNKEVYRMFSYMRTARTNTEVTKANSGSGPDMTELFKVVPAVYFSPDFKLEEQPIFTSSVSTRAASRPDLMAEGGVSRTPNKSPNKGGVPPIAAASLVQQEKLSHYLDFVEVHLFQQISSRFHSFLQGLQTMQELHSQITFACETIKSIRQRLMTLHDGMVQKALRVAQIRRRRANMESVRQKLELMAAIRQIQPTIQQLLSTSNFSPALDLIESAQETLKTKLVGISSVKHMYLQLQEMRSLVERFMENEFLSLATGWVFTNTTDVNDRSSSEVEERLMPLIHDLLRLNKLNRVISSYLEKLTSNVKLKVKELLNELTAGVPGPDAGMMREMESQNPSRKKKSAALAKIISMDHASFLNCWTQMLKRCIQWIRRISQIHKLLVAVVQASQEASLSKRDTYPVQCQAESAEVLQSMCDIVHKRVGQLLTERQNTHARLPMKHFRQIFNSTLEFVIQSEERMNSSCFPLRSVLLTQSKALLQGFHDSKVNQINLLLESERWEQTEVPIEIQTIVNTISKQRSGSRYVDMASISADSGAAKELYLEGEKFHVVGSTLMFIKMVLEYLQLAEQLPMLSADILHRLCEIMKLYNSRTCQLVLGAGALLVAKLKSITSKHLALAAQSIGLLFKFVPMLKATLAELLPYTQRLLLGELDRVSQDLDEHRQEIFGKLVLLLKERFESQCQKTIPTIQWNLPIASPNDYMKGLARDLSLMHKFTAELLSNDELNLIFGKILGIIKTKLPEVFLELDITTETAKQRIRGDLKYFIAQMRKLKGIESPTNSMANELEEFLEMNFPEAEPAT
eukprot:GILJ01005270.1.p1 GENE.GILJ01005270.1~~GILJ01005270.1.p1  ORF type:complete len:931 (-),score=140.73 GILJ01005270.1:171-2963(-)